MNAVAELVSALSRDAVARFLRVHPWDGDVVLEPTGVLRRVLAEAFELDLAGFLNQAERRELEMMADARRLSTAGRIGELRARLWLDGAELEADGCGCSVVRSVQPVPIVLRGKLVYLKEGRGVAPPAGAYPRAVGWATPAEPAGYEPETVEELLDNADRLIGVRLGVGRRDKGAFGALVAVLLGVRERGYAEPDWRGEVEIKTVPVVRDPAGWWRVKEDPAVSMEGASPRAKLKRVLWIARVADADDSPVLSWYYQEWSAELSELADRCLHTRPKGEAGTTARGWYLHKRYFIESGFLRSLNG